MIDVTARRRAGDESRGLREQPARVGRAALLGEVAASIAHAVNQPLCAIVSNAQAVRHMLAVGPYDPADVREAMEDIARDGRRASDVVGRIRDSLPMSAAGRAPVDVNDLVRGVAALLRGESPGAGRRCGWSWRRDCRRCPAAASSCSRWS